MTSLDQEQKGPPWIYPWRLRDGSEVRVANAELPSIHRTRAELIEPRVRAALAAAGSEATALDLACNEGWFSHRLLDWGASRVVAVDVREKNLQRAALMRDHFDIRPERLELRQGDVFELAPEDLGQYDVVLVRGLIYHVENPMGVLRLARGCTKSLCVIDRNSPVRHNRSCTDWVRRASSTSRKAVSPCNSSAATTRSRRLEM